MVGPCGLEPQTSTVSKSLQVKFQVRNFRSMSTVGLIIVADYPRPAAD
jgi:hypothetical protein